MRLKLPYLALALASLLALPLAAGETKEKAPAKPSAPAAGAAMKIHVDPATGQVVANPSPGEKKALAAAPAAELAPLQVEKVTTKAGGKKVNLQGRFVMEMTESVRPDGTVATSCSANETGAKAGASSEGVKK